MRFRPQKFSGNSEKSALTLNKVRNSYLFVFFIRHESISFTGMQKERWTSQINQNFGTVCDSQGMR